MRKIEDNLNKTAVYFGDSSSVDAFSRARVSNPVAIFDSQLTYDLQPLLFEKVIDGNATITHDTFNRCADIALDDADDGDKGFMQTYEYHRYQPSKSQLIFVTFNMNDDGSNSNKFIAYGDDDNAFEFRIRNGVPEFALRTSGTADEQVVAQSQWNLNQLNGTDIYSPIIDFTKSQILVIDFQSLYVGRVCFGFSINGNIIYCHEFQNANNLINPYIATANLPIRAGLQALSNGVTTSMKYICSAVVSEGGNDDTVGYSFSATNEVNVSSSVDTHLLTIQPRTTFNGFTNRVKFELESVDVIVKGNNPILYKLILGQALTGETVTDVNTTHSAMSRVTGTASGNGQIVISQGFVSQNSQVKQAISRNLINRYPITLDYDGNVRANGRLSVVARADNNNTTTKVAINWREIR